MRAQKTVPASDRVRLLDKGQFALAPIVRLKRNPVNECCPGKCDTEPVRPTIGASSLPEEGGFLRFSRTVIWHRDRSGKEGT
jgi:hypothetical protein